MAGCDRDTGGVTQMQLEALPARFKKAGIADLNRILAGSDSATNTAAS